MARSIFGGVRHQPYEPVYNAIADLGGSIRQGFNDVADAKQTAADFVLKDAQVRAGLRRDELEMPGLQAKAREAQNYLAEQDRLDEPMTTAYLANSILGANPEGYTLNHFFGNDIPGAILKATGATYNEAADTYSGPDGRVFTKRDFQRAFPMIEATVVAKTDPVKMAQDMRDAAEAQGDTAKMGEIDKRINDPKWMLDQYDKQSQYLIAARGAMIQQGYNPATIDGSLARIAGRQKQIGDMMELDKRLKLKQSSLKWAMTPKEITDLYIKAEEITMEQLAELDAQGQTSKWTPEQRDGWVRNNKGRIVEEAMIGAKLTKPAAPGQGGIDAAAQADRQRGKGRGSAEKKRKLAEAKALLDKAKIESREAKSTRPKSFWGGFGEGSNISEQVGTSVRQAGKKIGKGLKAKKERGQVAAAIRTEKYRKKRKSKKIDLQKVKEHRRDKRR
jgi:hypothetical protein